MDINCIEKLKTLLKVYAKIYKLPKKRQALAKLINPIDTTRYTEFSYLIKFIKMRNLNRMNVLDVSSPFMMSYILSSSGNRVIKTDINIEERRFINENESLTFRLEDATQLSFEDDTFDLVYSISVIEHIYEKYIRAISEMVRVVKQGGFIYLTFPVSKNHTEEWVVNDIYPHQYKQNNKVFFQYRFNENDLNNIIKEFQNIKVIDPSIYWERKNGGYDKIIAQLRKPIKNKYASLIKDSFINFIGGFALLENKPSNFENPRLFGNISILLEKNKG